MLLIYVPRLTNRIGYTLNVIFRHILKTDYEITDDTVTYKEYGEPKLCYAQRDLGGGAFIRENELMTKTTIEEQNPKPFTHNNIPALFPTYGNVADLPYDPISAAFYCLSRYEEYLPHFADKHGRFPATESLAYKNNFLELPVVDMWATEIANAVKAHFPTYSTPNRNFDYEDTFDIDAAYCYKHKGMMRTIGGALRDTFIERNQEAVRKRFAVVFNRQKDPFDTFDFIIDEHRQHPGIRLKFFPLMADYNVNDKSISYQNSEFQQLLKELCDNAKMGLHSSYASGSNPKLVETESKRLENILHRKTVRNRNHFLLLKMPSTYNTLIDTDILHDYTMGFADRPGFRAGTGTPFPFFNLETDCETPLTVHPFAVMDSTLYYYMKLSASEAETVYRRIIDTTHNVGGTFSALWHNQSLSNMFGWEGWADLYSSILDYAYTLKNKNKPYIQ